jgi:hypothetical protein
MGDDDEEDNEDDENGGDATTPPATAPAAAAPEVDAEEEEDPEMLISEQEAPKELEVILPDEEPEPLQPRLFTVLMRDHEESPSRVYDDLDDLDDSTLADYDVDDWFLEDGSCD